jgi:predicted N-acetyltransferase YhbS
VRVKIRRFREGDEEKTLQFLNSVFPNWGDDRKWHWKFEEVEKALERKAIVWVVEDDGEIVGHLAYVPMALRVANQVFPVCQLIDGVMSSMYRGRGVYTSLVREVLLDAERNGNAATFGFANRPAYHNYVRHGGFRKLCDVARMFKILSVKNAMSTVRLHPTPGRMPTAKNDSLMRDFYSIPRRQVILTLLDLFRVGLGSTISSCLRPASRVKPVPGVRAVEPNDLGKQLNASWIKFSSDYQFAFERDDKYLKWRYSQPGAEYRAYVAEKSGCVTGYVVIAVEERNMSIGRITLDGLKIGYIMDLVAEKDLVVPLLSIAEEELKKQKVCLANCWTIEDTLLFNTLRSMRYYQIPRELAKVTVVAKIHASHLEGVISSENSKRMLMSLGDTDHV